jgi:hypothetical protein
VVGVAVGVDDLLEVEAQVVHDLQVAVHLKG